MACRKNNESTTDKLKTKTIVIYFAALGTGFILIELALLQKLILLLGNPTMTFAILLFTMLLSSGVGSFVSSRLAKNNTNLTFVILGIAAIGALYVLMLPTIIYSVIAEQFVQKALISVGLLIPIGFLMGMPMPTGMRIVKQYKPTFVPWMWAINGAFSVLGAVLSVVVGITYGASYAMIVGIVAYLAALGVSFVWKRRSLEIIASS